jgi:hypothetical protein
MRLQEEPVALVAQANNLITFLLIMIVISQNMCILRVNIIQK